MGINNYIIADSSGLISLLALNDSNHQKANLIIETVIKKREKLILPYEVYAETMNIMGKKFGKKETNMAANYLFEYQKSGSLIFPDPKIETLKTAMKKFMQLSRSISYTDCLVMAIADEFETKTIFGFDEAFGKNGYILPGKS